MAYKVGLARQAYKQLGRLPNDERRRVLEAIRALADEPRPAGCTPVRTAAKGTFRLRVGDYRVIYTVVDQMQTVTVARVARRNERTYRWLDR